jgi:hypothetical protein
VSAARNPDEQLQVSRRVDWRFLLSSAELGRVAYVGRGVEALLESLARFSASLERIEGDPADRYGARFDVVVAREPDRAELPELCGLLEPGGQLYAEIVRRRSCRSVAAWVRAAERVGLVDVRAHWHWPGFESTSEIVPLDDPAAVRQSDWLARGKAGLVRLLVRLGWFERVVPSFSVVGRWAPAGGAEGGI